MRVHKSESIVPKDIDESDIFRLTDVEDMIKKANKLDGVGRGKEFGFWCKKMINKKESRIPNGITC